MRKKKLTDWEWEQVITDPSRLHRMETTGCDILTDPELLKAGCLGCVCLVRGRLCCGRQRPKFTFRLQISMQTNQSSTSMTN
jgi:hypothetical protein